MFGTPGQYSAKYVDKFLYTKEKKVTIMPHYYLPVCSELHDGNSKIYPGTWIERKKTFRKGVNAAFDNDKTFQHIDLFLLEAYYFVFKHGLL